MTSFNNSNSYSYGIALPSDYINSATFSFVIRIILLPNSKSLDINNLITSVVYNTNNTGTTLATSSSIIQNYPNPYQPSPPDAIVTDVQNFISEVLNYYTSPNSPNNIYTYLSQFNSYLTVTDVYSVVNSGSFTNAILPSCYESYFLTDPILLTKNNQILSSITIFYLNQSCAQNGCTSNIQFYLSSTPYVNFNGSINYYTINTSALLPVCSSSYYPTNNYSPTGCTGTIYTMSTINSTDPSDEGGWSTYTGYDYLIIAERVAYPVAVSMTGATGSGINVCSYPILPPVQPQNYNVTCSQTDSPYNLYSSESAYTVNFSVFPVYST